MVAARPSAWSEKIYRETLVEFNCPGRTGDDSHKDQLELCLTGGTTFEINEGFAVILNTPNQELMARLLAAQERSAVHFGPF